MPASQEVDSYKVAHYRWLNLYEAAEYCRCSVPHFYEHYRNRLPPSQPDGTNKVLYDSRDLDHLLEGDKKHPTKTYPTIHKCSKPHSTSEFTGA
jgi:hypothetical protein